MAIYDIINELYFDAVILYPGTHRLCKGNIRYKFFSITGGLDESAFCSHSLSGTTQYY